MISTIPQTGSTGNTVVLLHGIGRTRRAMFPVEKALKREGFDVFSISYPSRHHDIATLSGFLEERLDRLGVWQTRDRVHFVTHSMGGLVIRRYLASRKDGILKERLGRVVMLGPPNGGSEIADLLRNFRPYNWFYGPAGQELTTAAQEGTEAEPYYELGIVAGNRGWPYFVADRLIPGQHDGRVAVERTKLPGMTDHVTLPATHSFMIWSPKVHRQISHFLKEGRFEPAA